MSASSRSTLAAALAASSLGWPTGACARRAGATEAGDAPSYHATGIIKAFGPSRGYVNIAHEDIPGYMKAMTMSFEPGHPGQLDGFAVGDRVAFDFVETPDARRVLQQIQKRP